MTGTVINASVATVVLEMKVCRFPEPVIFAFKEDITHVVHRQPLWSSARLGYNIFVAPSR